MPRHDVHWPVIAGILGASAGVLGKVAASFGRHSPQQITCYAGLLLVRVL